MSKMPDGTIKMGPEEILFVNLIDKFCKQPRFMVVIEKSDAVLTPFLWKRYTLHIKASWGTTIGTEENRKWMTSFMEEIDAYKAITKQMKGNLRPAISLQAGCDIRKPEKDECECCGRPFEPHPHEELYGDTVKIDLEITRVLSKEEHVPDPVFILRNFTKKHE